jgi:hypothetical protein
MAILPATIRGQPHRRPDPARPERAARFPAASKSPLHGNCNGFPTAIQAIRVRGGGWAAAGGHVVADEHVFRDEGYHYPATFRPAMFKVAGRTRCAAGSAGSAARRR